MSNRRTNAARSEGVIECENFSVTLACGKASNPPSRTPAMASNDISTVPDASSKTLAPVLRIASRAHHRNGGCEFAAESDMIRVLENGDEPLIRPRLAAKRQPRPQA